MTMSDIILALEEFKMVELHKSGVFKPTLSIDGQVKIYQLLKTALDKHNADNVHFDCHGL